MSLLAYDIFGQGWISYTAASAYHLDRIAQFGLHLLFYVLRD